MTDIKVELTDGFDDYEIIDLAATMKRVVWKGKTYHKIQGVGAGTHPDGTRTKLYLRDDYGDRKMVQLGIISEDEYKTRVEKRGY